MRPYPSSHLAMGVSFGADLQESSALGQVLQQVCIQVLHHPLSLPGQEGHRGGHEGWPSPQLCYPTRYPPHLGAVETLEQALVLVGTGTHLAQLGHPVEVGADGAVGWAAQSRH